MRPRIEARIAQNQAEPEEAGIDIAWLLEQRWVVAEKRKKAALAVNRDHNGSDVQIGGFLIPAPPTEHGLPTACLAAEHGMGAHVPPPPPDQLLQLVLSDAAIRRGMRPACTRAHGGPPPRGPGGPTEPSIR